jgi:hypothetical protein
MAVVERAEREVMVELGVPGISVGVSGFEGGSGIPIKVGVAMMVMIDFPLDLLFQCLLYSSIAIAPLL